jgi:hypothetical protein
MDFLIAALPSMIRRAQFPLRQDIDGCFVFLPFSVMRE